MSTWCGVPVLVVFLAYSAAGVWVSSRLLKHLRPEVHGGWALFRAESYMPEGQSLFRMFARYWGWWQPFVIFLGLGVLSGLVCKLFGW